MAVTLNEQAARLADLLEASAGDARVEVLRIGGARAKDHRHPAQRDRRTADFQADVARRLEPACHVAVG